MSKEKEIDSEFRVSYEEAKNNYLYAKQYKQEHMPLPKGMTISFDPQKGSPILSVVWFSYRDPMHPTSFAYGMDRGVSINQSHHDFKNAIVSNYLDFKSVADGRTKRPTEKKEWVPETRPVQDLFDELMDGIRYKH